MSKYILSRVETTTTTYMCCVEADSEKEAKTKMSVGPISHCLAKEAVTLLEKKEENSSDIFVIKPFYQHDCEHCTFLGKWREIINGVMYNYDLYHCESNYPTVIARYGSIGYHYQSGLIGADYVPCLREAKHRALELCLNCDVNSKKG